MKKVCIFGSGGFSKEIYWLSIDCGYEVDSFLDTVERDDVYGISVKKEEYFDKKKHYAVIAVGDPIIRKKIAEKILKKNDLSVFINLISSRSDVMSKNVDIGYGSFICSNSTLTCDIKLGNWSVINCSTVIGHDVISDNFLTTSPGAKISGNAKIGECVYFGSNSCVKEKISICDNVIIGANAFVSKNITEPGTYIGVPAKKYK